MNTAPEKLQLDSALIQQWLDEGIDYDQEFRHKPVKKQTVTERPSSHFLSGFINSLSEFFYSKPMQYISLFLMFALIATGIYFLIIKKFSSPEVFNTDTNEDDNIYTIDFDKELEEARRHANHYQCIRLTYLQLLRHLQDNGIICWLPGKTVTQYNNEVRLEDFRRLTLLFSRIRYGNYTATADMVDEAYALDIAIRADIKSRIKNQPDPQS